MPFKKEVFSVIKTFWKPKESIYRHLHFKGPFEVKIDESKKFTLNNYNTQIENEIFWEELTGNWEKESLELWIKLCDHSQSIFDIGANTGIYALVAKTVNPGAKVYAFEPHPLFFERLKENVISNNYDISCYEKAISNFDGNLSIEDYAVQNQNISVEAVTLNSFISQNNITKVDLIKIDVETFEPQVMEGFSEYLSQFKPTMIIEILNDEVAEKVFEAVKMLDYLYFNIDDGRGAIRQTKTIEKSDYYNYLLCNKDIAFKHGLIQT